MALALVGIAVAQPADLRAPDQQVPATQPAPTADLRAPDQQVPATQPAPTADLRAPDQQVPATQPAPTPVSDGGPAAIVFVLIGVGAALVLLAGGYFGARYRHRVAIADDLVVE
jgi:hypothetical protein